jgi:hypothetical protein
MLSAGGGKTVARLLHLKGSAAASVREQERTMHWIKVTTPHYEQSRRYNGQVGEVIGSWGPENSPIGQHGFLVEFPDGEIVGIAENEIEDVEQPSA